MVAHGYRSTHIQAPCNSPTYQRSTTHHWKRHNLSNGLKIKSYDEKHGVPKWQKPQIHHSRQLLLDQVKVEADRYTFSKGEWGIQDALVSCNKSGNSS